MSWVPRVPKVMTGISGGLSEITASILGRYKSYRPAIRPAINVSEAEDFSLATAGFIKDNIASFRSIIEDYERGRKKSKKYDWGSVYDNTGGRHDYIMIGEIGGPIDTNRVTPELLSEEAIDAFRKFMSVYEEGETDLSEKSADGVIAVLAGRDSVILRDTGKVKFQQGGLVGGGETAETYISGDHSHSLFGSLSHTVVFDVKTKRYYKICYGNGSYPAPYIGPIVDLINSVVGKYVWKISHMVKDYKTLPIYRFRMIYGDDGLQEVKSFIYEKSYEAAIVKRDSFLGMGDDVFLGNPYGDHGYLIKGLHDMGDTTRLINKYLKRLRDKAGSPQR